MIIDHLGILVKSIEKGSEYWSTVFGYEPMTKLVVNVNQKVKVMFMAKEGSITIKLVEPIGSTSPVFNATKRGGWLHHVCFKCVDIESEIVDLKKNGLRVISPPQPGEAFNNNKIAFLLGKHGLNIELIDTSEKAQMIKL